MTTERSYFVLIDDKEKGPYSLEQVQTLLKAGEINETTLYCKPDIDTWYPVGQLLSAIRGRDEGIGMKRLLLWLSGAATLVFLCWLFGIIDAPTGFDAYRQARAYVRERLPLTAEFRSEDWRRESAI